MTPLQLVVKSLVHHWRTNLAVLMGVVAGTAVIGGALIVGDSVRASLRDLSLKRLSHVDHLLSGPRFVREGLAQDLQEVSPLPGAKVAPALLMQASLVAKTGETRRTGQVNVFGFDNRAWSMIQTQAVPPSGSSVLLNPLAASTLGVKVGDTVTLWIELPSAVPRDTLLGNKDNDSQEIDLEVAGITSESDGLSRLGFNPTQAMPVNAFVDLALLQERLDLDEVRPTRRDPTQRPARVNALLVSGSTATSFEASRQEAEALTKSVSRAWTLEDLSLRIVTPPESKLAIVESEQMILDDTTSTAVQSLPDPESPVMVYLANKLWNPRDPSAYSMYSTVAGLDVLNLDSRFGAFEFVGPKPESLGDNDVIINEWLAADLKLGIGDTLNFKYHLVGSRGELPEEEKSVVVRGIVRMTGAAADRNLTPQVKGITDVESLSDWDQPFEMDLKAVTPRDDDYWDKYRATPKMFVPLASARAWWPSRYGSLTSIRIARDAGVVETTELSREILQRLQPAELGLAFQPVKGIGLAAASGSTDFSGLFIGFSLFLIVAAMILIGLLFRLGVEQRVRDLGLLGAIGFSPAAVRNQMLLEGGLIVVTGGILGVVAAIGYAHGMIYGLTHWWIAAVGTRELQVSLTPFSVILGFLIAVVAALCTIEWALQRLKVLSLREQLQGVVEKEVNPEALVKQGRKARRRMVICVVLAAGLTLGFLAGGIPAAGAFFGVGVMALVATVSALSLWLNPGSATRPRIWRGQGIVALGELGARNARRQRTRSVMTAGMIATATFLIVAVAAFQRDPTSEAPDPRSGNGGFTIVAESSTPILYDLNTEDGRKKLQLSAAPGTPAAQALRQMHVVPFRVRPGDDASCLNLYQTQVPKLLGVPQSLIDDQRFAFASGSWAAINPQSNEQAAPQIPVLGDSNTLMYSLHKSVGQTVSVPNDESPRQTLKISGMFQDSVFQGVLVMHEQAFEKAFPEQKGFRYFLVEVPSELRETTITLLETELAEYGLDCEPVSERLARFLSVQNTYLSTFQTLGGLGLLLGTLGLATVMLRNVFERQSELALLQAIGFRKRSVGTLVLLENGLILTWGLAAGTISALVAAAPTLATRSGDFPVGSVGLLVAGVFAVGMASAAAAVRTAVRLPIVATLRGE